MRIGGSSFTFSKAFHIGIGPLVSSLVASFITTVSPRGTHGTLVNLIRKCHSVLTFITGLPRHDLWSWNDKDGNILGILHAKYNFFWQKFCAWPIYFWNSAYFYKFDISNFYIEKVICYCYVANNEWWTQKQGDSLLIKHIADPTVFSILFK